MTRSVTINFESKLCFVEVDIVKKKGKAVPLQAWSGPEGSRN